MYPVKHSWWTVVEMFIYFWIFLVFAHFSLDFVEIVNFATKFVSVELIWCVFRCINIRIEKTQVTDETVGNSKNYFAVMEDKKKIILGLSSEAKTSDINVQTNERKSHKDQYFQSNNQSVYEENYAPFAKNQKVCEYSKRHVRRLISQRTNSDLLEINCQTELCLHTTQATTPIFQSEQKCSKDRNKVCYDERTDISNQYDETKNKRTDTSAEKRDLSATEIANSKLEDKTKDVISPIFSKVDTFNDFPKNSMNPSGLIDNSKETDFHINYNEAQDADYLCKLEPSVNLPHVTLQTTKTDTVLDYDPKQISDRDRRTKLVKSLAWWATAYRISIIALTALLFILRTHVDSTLPKYGRTVLKTPKTTTDVISMGEGEYWHCGFEKAVKNTIRERRKRSLSVKNIKMIAFINGLPLFKSSLKNTWSILCSDDLLKKVYIVGAYYGQKKPENSNDFLKQFVDEAIYLSTTGCDDGTGSVTRITLHALVCDAPAKSYSLRVKSHTGYNSCTKCIIEGKYVARKQLLRRSASLQARRKIGSTQKVKKDMKEKKKGCICFPDLKQHKLRADEEMYNHVYGEDYQLGESILKFIPNFGLVSSVPLDYMHLLLLRAMRRLIWLWLSGPVRLSAYDVKSISKRMEEIYASKPSEFSRYPRSLREYRLWKATELRQFLLYTGPIVLKGIVDESVYNNFLSLHVATLILVSPTYVKNKDNIDVANSLLHYFVQSFTEIYGKQYVSYNIHNLLHICMDVKKYGCLDEFSAFRFENHMTFIKSTLRTPRKVLQQLARRSLEFESVQPPSNTESIVDAKVFHQHCDGPIIRRQSKIKGQYTTLQYSSFLIKSNDTKNNCVLLEDGTVALVENIILYEDGTHIIGRKVPTRDRLYNAPIDSNQLNIKILNTNSSDHVCSWPITSLQNKLWKIPYKSTSIVFPILHTEQSASFQAETTGIQV